MSATLYNFTADQRQTIDAIDGAFASSGFPPERFYDRDGYPITVGEAMVMKADPAYRVVERTEVASSGIAVSTIWTGCDPLPPAGDFPPIFETLIFIQSADMAAPLRQFEDWADHYATEAEAKRGHARAVAFVWQALQAFLATKA